MIAHPYDTGKQMNPTGLRLIAHCLERGNSLEQDKANAALIAAAPDLLEALEEMKLAFENHAITPGQNGALSSARAALSKARGEK